MRGVNKVILVGTLGRDPEVRYTPNGNAITNLSVATSEQWTDKQTQEKQERTEWHRVVIFGKKAEIAGQYLRKGSQVYLEGKLQTHKWQDQSGQDRYSTEIVLDANGQMQMLGSGRQQQDNMGSGPDMSVYDDMANNSGYGQNSNQGNGYQARNNGYNAPANNSRPAPTPSYPQSMPDDEIPF